MDSNTQMWQNSNHEDTIHPFLPSPGLPYFEPDLEVIFGSQLVRAFITTSQYNMGDVPKV
jgi:hypothetical protein